jgi:hypothetical protein
MVRQGPSGREDVEREVEEEEVPTYTAEAGPSETPLIFTPPTTIAEEDPAPRYEACANQAHHLFYENNRRLQRQLDEARQINEGLTGALTGDIHTIDVNMDRVARMVGQLTAQLAATVGGDYCSFCQTRQPGRIDLVTQTNVHETRDVGTQAKWQELEDNDVSAYYFLRESPPEGSRFEGDGSYITPKGTHITRDLRESFRRVRVQYRIKEENDRECREAYERGEPTLSPEPARLSRYRTDRIREGKRKGTR